MDDAGDKWEAERILSHSSTRTNAAFEILWKYEDITWFSILSNSSCPFVCTGNLIDNRLQIHSY